MATTEPLLIYNKFIHSNYRTTLNLQQIYTWQLQNHSQFTTNLYMATTEPLLIYNQFIHGNYRTTLNLQQIYTWQLQNHS